MFRILAILLLTFSTSLQSLVLEDLIESNALNEMLKGKRVGYYTGSFDPIHIGHQGFAKGVIERGLCDYVIIVPAWGGDGYKERAPVSHRLEMLYALFSDDPNVIVTSLSPQEFQRALTKENPNVTIKGLPVVEPMDPTLEFIGLIGSDTALNLSIPSDDETEEVNRKKRLQVFMRGVSISEKYAQTTIGSIMALPVDRFIAGLRAGDDLTLLKGAVGDRPISEIFWNERICHASSTLVKKRLRNGEEVTDLIHPSVLEIIQKYHLYGT